MFSSLDYSWCSISAGSHLWIQPTADGKHSTWSMVGWIHGCKTGEYRGPTKRLELPRILVWGHPGTNSPLIPRDNCMNEMLHFLKVWNLWLLLSVMFIISVLFFFFYNSNAEKELRYQLFGLLISYIRNWEPEICSNP